MRALFDDKLKQEAVESYLRSGTLQEKAAVYNVHRNTLWRWVKLYHKGGFEGLAAIKLSSRHWRRTPADAEDRVVFLKESDPSLTVREARKILASSGMIISQKGIWNVWKRFGYTGFLKNQFTTSYRDYIAAFPVTDGMSSAVTKMIEQGKTAQAADIVNQLPVFMDAAVLGRIPETYLSLRRKIEYLGAEFGSIPLSQFLHKARTLRQQLERRKMRYSALRIAVEEGSALTWMGRPRELLRLASRFKKARKGLRDPGLHIAFLFHEGHALGSLLKIPEALQCAKECKKIMRRLGDSPFLMSELSALYSVLGYFREAIFWATKALKGAGGNYRKHLCASLVGYLTTAGDYRSAARILKEGRSEEWDFRSRELLCRAFIHLNKGDFQNASSLAIAALEQSKKEGIKRYFHLATFILACCHASVGQAVAARTMLKRYNPLLKKHRLEKEYFLRRILLGDSSIPRNALLVPSLKLAHLFCRANMTMKTKDYHAALGYARSQSLFGLFERLALFFPEIVLRLLNKGKDTGLPRSFLTMPAFQIESPVYYIKILGRLRICKGQSPIRRARLNPKDAAFLIHLSLKKNRRLALSDIYCNFWPKSGIPSKLVSHLLVRIKKAINLPSELLKVSGDLLVWKFHISTDYDLFSETLIQAKALERAGEWAFAKKEYLRAFKLFGAEPFRKMYDQWSEDARHRILSRLETAALAFAGSCLARGDKKQAKSVLEKTVKIIPGSDKIRNLLDQPDE